MATEWVRVDGGNPEDFSVVRYAMDAKARARWESEAYAMIQPIRATRPRSPHGPGNARDRRALRRRGYSSSRS
jgi:hypothetical protein